MGVVATGYEGIRAPINRCQHPLLHLLPRPNVPLMSDIKTRAMAQDKGGRGIVARSRMPSSLGATGPVLPAAAVFLVVIGERLTGI